ncbi:hypothetical protein HDU81_000424 [Chytriomyces hyalinus]|nr:hypothetical protein HDU81_000424 [Chytriomyces hyalinus]
MTLRNMTARSLIPSLAKANSWNVNIPYSPSDSSPSTLSVASVDVDVMGCTARSTSYDVSPQVDFSSFGFSLDSKKSDGTYAALTLKSKNYQPSYLKVRQNSCAKKTGLAIFGSSNLGDSLGAVVVTTSNAFNSTLIRDLLQPPIGVSAPNASLCGVVRICENLQIQDAVVMQSGVLLSTNRGLYMSSKIPSSSQTSPITFRQVMTGASRVDDGVTSVLPASLVLGSTADCVTFGGTYLYVAFAGPTTSIASSLIYTTEANLSSNSWSSVLSSSSISGLNSAYSFFGMARYAALSSNVYLLGVPSTSCGTASCAMSAAIVLHNTTSNATSVAFTFPSSASLVGLSLHMNGLDLYAYGSKLWHSIDGGRNWIELFSFTSTTVVECFTKLDSSVGDETIALVTNLKNFYYARAGTKTISKISSVKPPSLSFADVMVDQLGNVFATWIATPASYPDTASLYPLGFLNSPSGDVRNWLDPYLKRVSVAKESAARVLDVSFAASIVPVFIGPWRVQFYASGAVNGAVFQDSHVGMRILLAATGGSAVIKSVSSQGYIADCVITQSFVGDSTTRTPALDRSLVIAGNTGAVTSPTISDSTSYSTSTLTLSGSGSGVWYTSDVGKTVVANFGSFLITAYSSTTAVTVSVIRAPLTVGTVLTGSWSVYDFRSYIEYNTNSQSITIGSVSSGLATVTLAAGTMTFSSALKGMFLVTNDGWGVVQDVTGTSTLLITPFETPTGTYAQGSWSLFDVNQAYAPGTFPTQSYRTRPWNLTSDDCPWSNSKTSAGQVAAKFVSYEESISILSDIQTANYADNPYYNIMQQSVIITNPKAYNFSVSTQTSRFAGTVSANLTLNDVGSGGRVGVTVRPACASLLCPSGVSGPLQLLNSCSPSRKIKLHFPLSRDEFLYGNPVFLDNLPALESLPVNYRPPSALGAFVPTTANIYNADPSQPRYNNRYGVSQRTGEYKQCQGKADRASCNCTEDQRYAMKASASDCINRVERVLNEVPYQPEFEVHDNGMNDIVLMKRYTLVELNNRTDYCLCVKSAIVCGNSSVLSATTLDPSTHDGIYWLPSSSELYHFRLKVVEKEYCRSLYAEFAVYVIISTPRTAVILTYMSISSVSFGVILLVAYLMNRQRQKKASF